MPVELTAAISALRSRTDASGARWCDRAHDLFVDLMMHWRLRSTGEPAWAGYAGISLPVVRADRTAAVLKVSVPRQLDLENRILACWQGRRAVRLLARDDARHARLLERLSGPSLFDEPDRIVAMGVAGELTAVLAVPPPEGVPRIADLVDGLAEAVQRSSVGALSRRDLDVAAATFRELGADQPATLLHGDLHGSNVLRTAAGTWSVIDPWGLVGDPALEALTMLHDHWTELPGSTEPHQELLDRLRAFADAGELDPGRVLAWTHARCVRAVIAEVNDDDGMHAWVAAEVGRERW